MIWEVYIRSALGHDQLAEAIRHLLNLPGSNPCPGSEQQRRDSVNWGGVYWLYEVLGIKLRLLANGSGVTVDERSDYPFYLAIETESDVLSHALATHVAELLADNGFDAVVDRLT